MMQVAVIPLTAGRIKRVLFLSIMLNMGKTERVKHSLKCIFRLKVTFLQKKLNLF